MANPKMDIDSLRQAGLWEEALQRTTADLAKKRSFIDFLWRGFVYRDLGQHEAAIADFTEAMTWNTPDPVYYRGNAYLAMGQYAEAATDHQRYLDMTMEKNNSLFDQLKKIAEMLKSTPGKPRAVDYPPLSHTHHLNCQLSINDCEKAIVAGHQTPLIYFCQGVAYESDRDFFKAMALYQKIDPQDAVGPAAQMAIGRAGEMALSIAPTDKKLMRPGIEYLRMFDDRLAKTFTCEYFDLDSFRQDVVPYTNREKMPFSSDWKITAQFFSGESAYHYAQRQKPL